MAGRYGAESYGAGQFLYSFGGILFLFQDVFSFVRKKEQYAQESEYRPEGYGEAGE